MKALIAKTRPALFYKVQDVASRVQITQVGDHIKEKIDARNDANKFTKDVVKTMISEGHITREQIADDVDTWIRAAMGISGVDTAATTKLAVHYFLYMKCIKNLGTEKHHEYVLRAADLTDWGAFGLTELGHGSNVQDCETTASYDHQTKEFVLNSPTDTSIKFWIGNLGKTANMMVCFAQLYVDGQSNGLHAFLVPVRDRKTHMPFPGLRIGDCGDKIGLQAMDNGWIKFENYRIPVDNLLNKISNITEDGQFATTISKGSKRFATQVNTLSGGRILA
jgi:acyl-CoA oxidase